VARSALRPPLNCFALGQGGPLAIGLVPTKGHRSAVRILGRAAPPRIARTSSNRLPSCICLLAHSLRFTYLLAQANAHAR